ncbi:S8 family serine peptidase [Psychroserpens sp.]|uniref:S8 family serine peptidase n=1 Tax=Psychroserpens sp. TaxID=2020870 RepID=UPI003C7680AA
MKRITKKAAQLLALSLIISSGLFAQTLEQKAAIARSYDQALLKTMGDEFSRTFKEEFAAAKAYAAANNIPVTIEKENGGIAVLHKVLDDGSLLYTSTTNEGAGITIRANRLYPGSTGTLDLELEGEGIVIGVWDGGFVLPTHELLSNRVSQIDDATGLSSHATHVSGTIIGSGTPQNGAAKGMAPKATLLASDFGNDLGEMTPQAAAGLLLSNHSYGVPAGNVPTWFLGNYRGDAQSLDQLLYNTPYYMPVFSAGNDRNTGVNPGDNGYDLLTGDKVAKNNIVVAAVNGVANYTGPGSVVMSGFSSWGPTDDGRIKPDISAKGVNTFSSVASNNTAYANFSGTSMAAPSITGGLALLQELHSDIHGSFMKSATLKALIIHTALEAGTSPGPDFRFGWGLLNAEAAAQTLLDEGFASIVDENSLANTEVFTRTVTSNGIDPLIVSIVWTDLPGNVQSMIEDDITSRLVNDLDVVLEDQNGNLFYPWKFIPGINNIAPTKGINSVDNVEKVEIDAPVGTYTIRVTHKGILQTGLQDFSLIATGISEADFTYTADNIFKTFCSNEVAQYQFNYESSLFFNGPTNLSVSGLPSGVQATFTPDVITSDEDFILEISGLDTIDAGSYPFTVLGSSSGFSKSIDMELVVESAAPLNSTIIDFPSDGATDVFIYPTLTWNDNPNASQYSVEISTTSDFLFSSYQTVTTQNSISVPGLSGNSLYYWRVKAFSNCVEGEFATASFTTESTICSPIVAAVDTPINISTVPNTIQSVITIPQSQNVLIGDLNVSLDITHSWISDLTITLTSPEGTEVILIDGVCGDSDNANVIFDDSGFAFSCSSSIGPAINGMMQAQNLLTSFVEENSAGDWTLTITDGFNQDGGSLNDFGLEICSTAGSLLSVEDNQLSTFDIYPNPADDYFEFTLKTQNGSVDLNVYDVNGRILMNKTFDEQNKYRVSTENLTSGIYFVEVTSGSQKAVKKLVVK